MSDWYGKMEMERVSTMMTDPQIRRIVNELGGVLQNGVAGDVVEFGCNVGTTSVFLKKTMMIAGDSGRQLWCYDSFQGLPELDPKDHGWWNKGWMKVGQDVIEGTFRSKNLPLPIIKSGWFNELKKEDVPSAICFAYLDCDLYSSMMDAIRIVWPRLSSGAIMAFHDANTPGVVSAINESLIGKPCKTEWYDREIYGLMGIRKF